MATPASYYVWLVVVTLRSKRHHIDDMGRDAAPMRDARDRRDLLLAESRRNGHVAGSGDIEQLPAAKTLKHHLKRPLGPRLLLAAEIIPDLFLQSR